MENKNTRNGDSATIEGKNKKSKFTEIRVDFGDEMWGQNGYVGFESEFLNDVEELIEAMAYGDPSVDRDKYRDEIIEGTEYFIVEHIKDITTLENILLSPSPPPDGWDVVEKLIRECILELENKELGA